MDGILVQLPLPPGLDSQAAVSAIDPGKDADGLHPHNLGLLVLDQPGPRPCTPSAVMRILSHFQISVSGARAVVVGRSFLVGRPLALMLSAKGADAIFITIDVDGLDPAIMPATGTPEPGGLSWYEALALLRATIERRKVIGCDVVELSPLPGVMAPNFLCAKLVYKILTYRFASLVRKLA